MDLSSMCSGLTERICSQELAVEFRPVFIFVGILLFIVMVVQLVWVTQKIKKKKLVYWIGFVLFDIVFLLLLLLSYVLLPYFIRWFNIIKIG